MPSQDLQKQARAAKVYANLVLRFIDIKFQGADGKISEPFKSLVLKK